MLYLIYHVENKFPLLSCSLLFLLNRKFVIKETLKIQQELKQNSPREKR